MSEVKDFLNKHPNIKFIDVLNYDLCGVMRGKRLDVSQLEKIFKGEFLFPSSCVLLDVTGNNTDPDDRGFGDGDPDVPLLPIPGTLTSVPWKNDVAQVLTTYFEHDGSPMIDDPRHMLSGIVNRLRGLGLNPVAACELEFYLIDSEPDEDGRPKPPMMPKSGKRPAEGQVFSMAQLDDYADFIRDIAEACEIQGIPAGPALTEYAAGQFEINLNHVDDAVAACDHAALLQRVIRGVALNYGCEATFMAKPLVDGTGNGFHIHCSLEDEKGSNVFDDGGADGTDLLRHAIAGMLETMAEGMAFFAPNLNSYRRYQPDSFVAMAPTWGHNNRSVAIRIPGGSHKARRFEHRVAGADANPYLVMAAILSGVLHGIENKIEPSEISIGDTGHIVDEAISKTWQQGLDTLEKAKILPTYMTETYCRRYRLTKQVEMDRFNAVISAREYEWYLISR
jgi:glutamine synthetase